VFCLAPFVFGMVWGGGEKHKNDLRFMKRNTIMLQIQLDCDKG